MLDCYVELSGRNREYGHSKESDVGRSPFSLIMRTTSLLFIGVLT